MVEFDPLLVAERDSLLGFLVPAGNADDRPAELAVQFNGVLGDVAEPLNGRHRVLGPQIQLLEGLADREHHAVARGFLPPQRAAHAHRLAGDEARILAAVNLLELVQHPEHVLGTGHDVRRRHVEHGPHVAGDGSHPGPTQILLFSHAEVVRIANHAALAAAQRNVHHGALPRHPH